MRRCANIKECKSEDIDPDRPRSEQRYCLYAKSNGKLLGRHSTIDEAQKQEAAIHARGGNTMDTTSLEQAELDALADRLEEIIADANDHLAHVDLPEPITKIYVDPRIGGGLVDLHWQQEPAKGAYASTYAKVEYVARDGKYLGDQFDIDLYGEVADSRGMVSLNVGPTTLVDSYEFDQYDLEHYRDLAGFFANALPTEDGEPVGRTLVRSLIDVFQRERRTGVSMKTSKYLRLAEVPESAVKSLYRDEWGQSLMKAIGDEVNIDSKAAQFLFFTAWNGVIQLMDKTLQEKQDVDTTEYSQDPTFMQALTGLAYFVTDDALKSSLGVQSDSLSKAKGHAETLMQFLGKEAPVDKTLDGLKAQAKPIAEKSFDALMDWLKQQPAKEQKAAHVAEVKDPIKARTALVKTAFTKVAAEGWGIFWMPQAGKGGAWLVGKDDGSGNMQILSSESDLSSDELIEMAAKKVPGLDKASTKVYPKTASTRLGSADDVESVVRPLVEKALEQYEPWFKQGPSMVKKFHAIKDAWIADIASYVFQAEESGSGDVTGIDYNDYAKQLANSLFEAAPTWELEASDKGQMDIYYDLKDVEDSAIDAGFEAAAASLQSSTFAHVDAQIRKWARRQVGNTGHRSLWLQDVVAMTAQPEAWVDAAEQAGLYVPASMQRQAYVHEYIQAEMNDVLATDLKEKSLFGKVGKFTFGEGTDHHKGQWGLWFVTPAVEDVTAVTSSKEHKKMRKKTSKKATKTNDKYLRYAGHVYRRADDELLLQEDGPSPELDDSPRSKDSKVSDDVVKFFKSLKKASARGKWARTAKRQRTCCSPRSRDSESVELPTDCVEQLVGARYSDGDLTTFEKKGDKWFVEGVDSRGVIDDVFVQMAQSTCEMATTAATKRKTQYAEFDEDTEFVVPFDCMLGFYGIADDEYPGADDTLVTVYKEDGEWHVHIPGSTGDDDYMFAPESDEQAQELLEECVHGRQAATKRKADQEMLPGMYEETIEVDPSWSSMGKFDHYVDDAVIYSVIMDGGDDDSLGNADDFGAYDLVTFPGGVLVKEPDGTTWTFEGAIAFTNSQGFVDVEYYDTVEEAQRAWRELEAEHDSWLEETAADYF